MNVENAFPSDTADKVLVRMPEGMRKSLKDEAKANNRTMNAEIVSRLQESFEAPKLGFGPGSVGAQIEEAKRNLDLYAAEKRAEIAGMAKEISDLAYKQLFERATAARKKAK